MSKGTFRSCKDCVFADIVDGDFNDCQLTGNSEPIPAGAMDRFGADALKSHAYYFLGVCAALEKIGSIERLGECAAHSCSFYGQAEGVLTY